MQTKLNQQISIVTNCSPVLDGGNVPHRGILRLGMAAFVAALVLISPASADTIYVDQSYGGPWGYGESWDRPYRSLQDALADAAATSGDDEILVATGTYRPDDLDEDASFDIPDGVILKGGYAVVAVDLLGDPVMGRNPGLFPTKLSGILCFSNRSKTIINVDGGEIRLDGLTIEAARNDCSGGGMYISAGSVEVVDCLFTDNEAALGGAIYLSSDAQLVIQDCEFVGNRAEYFGGALLAEASNAGVEIYTTVFDSNSSGWGGGAIYTGGAMWLESCLFTDNSVDDGRSAAVLVTYDVADGGSCWLINCTVSENVALYGVALSATSYYSGHYPLIVVSSIVWANKDYAGSVGEQIEGGVDVFVSHSCTTPGKGSYLTYNVIHSMPRFENRSLRDFHLRSSSPCIDTGSNFHLLTPDYDTDLDGNDRELGAGTDMGAYEYMP